VKQPLGEAKTLKEWLYGRENGYWLKDQKSRTEKELELELDEG
jgi:hypothetical protein